MLDALWWTQEHMKEMRRKEVIIIAGPSASGKSYLMRQLTTKKKNDFKDKVYRELGINSHKPRSSISIGALKNLDKKPEHLRKLKKKSNFYSFRLNKSPPGGQNTTTNFYSKILQKNQSLDDSHFIQNLA